MNLPSIVAEAKDYSPDTVKARARAVLLLAVERTQRLLEDNDNELKANELAGIISSVGRVSGIADAERDSTVSIHIVRDQPASATSRLVDAHPSTLETEPARLLGDGES